MILLKILFITTLYLLLLVKPVSAQWVFPTFPPCFPFCTSPTPTKTPTLTPIVTTQAPQPTPTQTPSTCSLYFGAYVGDGFWNLNNISNFERTAKKGLSIVLFYQAWGVSDDTKNFQTTWMNNIRNHGSIPLVTWEPWNYSAGVNQPNYSLQTIINGNHDSYITKWALDSKAWGKPYFLRFAHEMNGTWYPWAATVNGNTPTKYIEAYKHVRDIFTANNVTNVIWVWSPNVSYPGSTDLSLLYPGDNYVDWVGIDGYNWGNINGGWQTFTQLFNPTYQQVTNITQKPIMISETASAEQGGSKSKWITNALGNEIDSMPKIKALVWFNANKEKDWRINSSTTSKNAFISAISNSKYCTNSYSALNTNIK